MLQIFVDMRSYESKPSRRYSSTVLRRVQLNFVVLCFKYIKQFLTWDCHNIRENFENANPPTDMILFQPNVL